MKEQTSRISTEKIVAKNINAYRFMLGLDYEKFAERVRLTPDRIRDMESGKDTLANGIELLRIAEACNVSYADLFEDEKSGATSAKNAHFPNRVWQGIYQKAKMAFPSNTAFAKIISVHPSTPGLWYKGTAHPNPFAFQNIITILKLKAVDLEAMGKETVEQVEPVKIVEEPATITATLEPATTAPENIINPDTFESKVVKVIRFQKDLPSFIAKLDKLESTIKALRQQLEELI